ncbi:hypothetical protein [Streptomyces sp. NBC_01614]|uniref:hypothetical protein n=1 Tax=Streptomyces sp. NBC_01614 TaxID=2975897 RepID=UPI00386DD119
MSQNELRTMLAQRRGLAEDLLWFPVHDVPRSFGLSWPLTGKQAEEVLSQLLDRLRRVLPPPLEDEQKSLRGRYVYLSEVIDRYERCDTRRLLERIYAAGVTPARLDPCHEEYDPDSEEGWGVRPSAAPDFGGKPAWGWWRAVREAGPLYRMPDPYVGDREPPVDRALVLHERTGDGTGYRAALLDAVREDPRQIDCWAHLGSDAFARAETDSAALSEALGFYQTAVAVAELSLPSAFSGVLAWSEMDNRPFPGVPQKRGCPGPRKGGLICGNARRHGDGACP